MTKVIGVFHDYANEPKTNQNSESEYSVLWPKLELATSLKRCRRPATQPQSPV
jgi:hypothetical protein